MLVVPVPSKPSPNFVQFRLNGFNFYSIFYSFFYSFSIPFFYSNFYSNFHSFLIPFLILFFIQFFYSFFSCQKGSRLSFVTPALFKNDLSV